MAQVYRGLLVSSLILLSACASAPKATGMLRPRPRRKPRRPFTRRLPQTRRPEMAQTHLVFQGRPQARLQTCAAEAADGRAVYTEGAGVLNNIKVSDPVLIFRYLTTP